MLGHLSKFIAVAAQKNLRKQLMDGGPTGTNLIEIVKGGHTPGPPQ